MAIRERPIYMVRGLYKEVDTTIHSPYEDLQEAPYIAYLIGAFFLEQEAQLFAEDCRWENQHVLEGKREVAVVEGEEKYSPLPLLDPDMPVRVKVWYDVVETKLKEFD